MGATRTENNRVVGRDGVAGAEGEGRASDEDERRELDKDGTTVVGTIATLAVNTDERIVEGGREEIEREREKERERIARQRARHGTSSGMSQTLGMLVAVTRGG